MVYGGPAMVRREDGAAVGNQVLERVNDGDMAEMWRQFGELMAEAQTRTDTRFDRMEVDVAVLKTDVAVLKTDVAVLKVDVAGLRSDLAETNRRLSSLEISTERRFDRVDARLEELIGLIKRDELKK